MCDCYEGECAGCGKKVQIHIGDFSQDRRNVYVWCPRCHKKFHKWMTEKHEFNDKACPTPYWVPLKGNDGNDGGPWMLFLSSRKQGVFIFLVEQPRVVHVNG